MKSSQQWIRLTGSVLAGCLSTCVIAQQQVVSVTPIVRLDGIAGIGGSSTLLQSTVGPSSSLYTFHAVTNVFSIGVSNDSSWIIGCKTEHVVDGQGAIIERAVVRGDQLSGTPLMWSLGQPALQPFGHLDTIIDIGPDALGSRIASVVKLVNTTSHSVYSDYKRVITPGIGTGDLQFPQWKYNSIGSAISTTSPNYALVPVTLEDAGATAMASALMRLDIDANGNLVGEHAVTFDGKQYADLIDGSLRTVIQSQSQWNSRRKFAINNSGKAICSVRWDGSASSGSAIVVGELPVVQEGAPLPGGLGNAGFVDFYVAVDINNLGTWVCLVRREAGSPLILRGNDKVIADGDPVPGVPGATAGSLSLGLSNAAVHINALDQVLWWGRWVEPSGVQQGVFLYNGLNNVLLIDTKTLGAQSIRADSFAMSPDGKWVLIIADYADGASEVLLLSVL